MNEGLYCLAEDGVNVTEGPKRLPQNWQDSSGTWHYNINNEIRWNDTALIGIGWYPYVLVDPGAPNAYYDRSLSAITIEPTQAVQTAIYTQWDIERVKESKNVLMEQQLVQYTANQGHINPKVSEYVNDDAKWFDGKQAELARITDWNQAAAFDTAKPMVLTLPNSWVGAKNVRQGVNLTSQNDAAVSGGLPPIYDQGQINAYISGNQLAADDSSNATAPIDPPFEFRQAVANVSEQFNRVIIYRFDRDDPIPSLRRSFAMQMTNREDARDLYVFTYTGTTYLAWHKFELQPDGVTWLWEASPSEMQYTDTDMAFIFSYGTNPAVEADYFTDRVEFDAGVDNQSLLVAWDPQ